MELYKIPIVYSLPPDSYRESLLRSLRNAPLGVIPDNYREKSQDDFNI